MHRRPDLRFGYRLVLAGLTQHPDRNRRIERTPQIKRTLRIDADSSHRAQHQGHGWRPCEDPWFHAPRLSQSRSALLSDQHSMPTRTNATANMAQPSV